MEIKKRLEQLREILKIEEKKSQIEEMEKEMQSPNFWTDEKESGRKLKKSQQLKESVKTFEDIYDIAQIASEEELESLSDEIGKLETETLMSGKFDSHSAIISFYSGAGGVDAQDWTEMLLKMYLKWAEKNAKNAIILSESKGGEAGIKSATVEISGTNIYGLLKGESGVHRLVRQSPFNAKNLRQTSFAMVEVMPEIESSSEVEIDSKDLKVETFRASGCGGQSVNTTDSAVRIRHLPTGITVSCQNERSQLQNKETAMKILRSRIAALLITQHKERVDEIRGDYSSPEWGNQIRSYVLHPYKLVKDHRTGIESKSPDQVLSGDLDKFIEAELRSVNRIS